MRTLSDIHMPRKLVCMTADYWYQQFYETEISHAVNTVKQRNSVPKVLDISNNCGITAMIAAKHGANHVTSVVPWKYIYAITCKAILLNNMTDKIPVVLHKEPIEITIAKN